MLEEEIRMQAVTRHTAGEAPASICSQFRRSRRWLFKWVNRYRAGEEQWFKDHSRRPRDCPQRTVDAVERMVVEAREKLMAVKYSQVGPQRLAIPTYLQMDNQLPLRGSNRHPRSFGLVIRLCLHLGIQPVFIPLGEPWRNGCVERFQDVFDKVFFGGSALSSFRPCVQRHPYLRTSTIVVITTAPVREKHRTSAKPPGQRPPRRLAEGFEFPRKLYIEPGRIHIMRFIRSDAVLDIFGESLLSVIHDNHIVHQQEFKVTQTPMDCPW